MVVEDTEERIRNKVLEVGVFDYLGLKTSVLLQLLLEISILNF